MSKYSMSMGTLTFFIIFSDIYYCSVSKTKSYERRITKYGIHGGGNKDFKIG